MRLAEGQPLPNIVLIVVDTLRGDRLGELTPAMDRLAAEGVLFERATSAAPWTLPSMASMFSGFYPDVHGVKNFRRAASESVRGAEAKVTRFGDEFETLAELLRARGYETAAFVANAFLLPKFGFDQGFDLYDVSMASNTTHGSRLNQAALEWLDRRKDGKPFFLYVHYMDVHSPYTNDPRYVVPRLDALPEESDLHLIRVDPPGHWRAALRWVGDARKHARFVVYQEYWRARYDAGVRLVDDVIAELRAGLEQRGVFEQAYTILTADHGEALHEHDLWDHGLSVHETDMHVPLVLRWPGALSRGQRVETHVSLIDLLPTLADQLGARPPGDLQGISLIPLLAGGRLARGPIFGEGVFGGPDQKAVYSGRWKLIQPVLAGSRAQLYDLVADPGEHDDLAVENEAMAADLRQRIEDQGQRNAQLAHDAEAVETQLSEEERARLEALGYVN